MDRSALVTTESPTWAPSSYMVMVLVSPSKVTVVSFQTPVSRAVPFSGPISLPQPLLVRAAV